MDNWIAAFKAIGGITAIGVLIDLAMYRSEKAKLKALLEDWWLRFTYVRWSNFGREESERAIEILDRWAGPRLWSWKRWRFATIVASVTFSLVVFWAFIRGALSVQPREIYPTDVLGVLFVAVALFAPSLSVNRFIAWTVARLSLGTLFGVTAFSLMLIIHWLLLVYWSAIPRELRSLVSYEVLMANISLGLEYDGLGDGPDLLERATSFGQYMWSYFRETNPFEFFWCPLFCIDSSGFWGTVLLIAFGQAMDLLANGLRIVFALIFLSSFVFRPLIQEPLSRLWYGAINSDKPTFTMLFGAIGTLVAAGQALAN